MADRRETRRILDDAVHRIAELSEGPAAGVMAFNGVTLRRIGRNEVWRIDLDDNEVFFAKRWREPVAFDRELLGFRLAQRLAGTDPRFMAVDLVLVDPGSGMLVTSEMNGSPVSSWLQRGLRFDKNLLRRREPLEHARSAVRAATEWLTAFHEMTVDPMHLLYDHGVSGMISRINRALGRTVSGVPIRDQVGAGSQVSAMPSASEEGLVLGDATLGNFIFDGERVGVVDFEDIGIGPSQRDFSVFLDSVQGAMQNLLYHEDREIRQLIPGPSDSELEQVIQLELHLYRFEFLCQNRGMRSVIPWRRERAHIRTLMDRIQGTRTNAGKLEA